MEASILDSSNVHIEHIDKSILSSPLHTLIPVKAPAHEQTIYNENIVGNGAHDIPPLSNVIHHPALAFSLLYPYNITLLRNK